MCRRGNCMYWEVTGQSHDISERRMGTRRIHARGDTWVIRGEAGCFEQQAASWSNPLWSIEKKFKVSLEQNTVHYAFIRDRIHKCKSSLFYTTWHYSRNFFCGDSFRCAIVQVTQPRLSSPNSWDCCIVHCFTCVLVSSIRWDEANVLEQL